MTKDTPTPAQPEPQQDRSQATDKDTRSDHDKPEAPAEETQKITDWAAF